MRAIIAGINLGLYLSGAFVTFLGVSTFAIGVLGGVFEVMKGKKKNEKETDKYTDPAGDRYEFAYDGDDGK